MPHLLEIQDPSEKALKYFNRILDAFEQYNINPTPLNYYVWYQYFKGDNPQLRQEMDQILDDPFGYHDRIGRRLYQAYFSDHSLQDLTGFDYALKRLFGVMAKQLQAWSDRLDHQTSDLENCAGRLHGGLSQDEIDKIAKQVINSAKSISESSHSFSDEMLQHADDIQQLRQQLIEAKAEALQDELTKIGNRKAFNYALKDLIDEVDNGSVQNVFLVLSDIDHFKSFNDTYGHLIGDSILRYYAKILQRNEIPEQSTCRYGGEEFAMLFKNVDLEKVLEVTEKCRTEIEAAHLKRKDSREPLRTITASFGIAQYKAGEAAEVFIKRSDDALYHAKKTGRNRIVTEQDLEQLR